MKEDGLSEDSVEISEIPFGLQFAQPIEDRTFSSPNTTTTSMNDDDTNAYKSWTDDYDT